LFLTLNFPDPVMKTSSPFDREVLTVSRTYSTRREDSNLEMPSRFSDGTDDEVFGEGQGGSLLGE